MHGFYAPYKKLGLPTAKESDAMPRPLVSSQALRQRFDLYLSLTEIEQIRASAVAAKLPMSTYLRRVALRQTVEMPPVEFAVEQWQSLGRLANNINQIAKSCNSGLLPDGVHAALADVTEQVRQLRIEVLAITPHIQRRNPRRKK